MPKKILVVDDDPAMVRLMEQVLAAKDFSVVKAGNGQEALRVFFEEKPDLVLLDVVMPGMDGWQTCSRIREVSDVPVIMLTGEKQSEDDIVLGLSHGADEYLIKPVGNRELLARVQAALRRSELPARTEKKKTTGFSDEVLSVDILDRKVTLNGERVKLTATEFRLLALLVENTGKILSNRQILEKVWGWEYSDDIDYVRIYIAHLRQKIEPNPGKPKYVLNDPGVGYYFQKNT
jgi:two-component system, OmpR family, KDP operon response regulator KdpE